MLPNLIMAGAQKSASTFLGLLLNQHPEAYIKTREDVHFEDPEYSAYTDAALDIECDKKVYGIRRPQYFGHVECMERVAKHLPEAKYLIILREPVS